MLYRPHLNKTVRIALVVGTALFVINQLDVVLRGQATPLVWFKIALTYLVPFCVSVDAMWSSVRGCASRPRGDRRLSPGR